MRQLATMEDDSRSRSGWRGSGMGVRVEVTLDCGGLTSLWFCPQQRESKAASSRRSPRKAPAVSAPQPHLVHRRPPLLGRALQVQPLEEHVVAEVEPPGDGVVQLEQQLPRGERLAVVGAEV